MRFQTEENLIYALNENGHNKIEIHVKKGCKCEECRRKKLIATDEEINKETDLINVSFPGQKIQLYIILKMKNYFLKD